MSEPAVRISVFAKTDLGRTRDHNEDTFLVADLTRGSSSLQPEVRQHELGERGSLFMVADGMGRAAAGELASEMAAESIYTYLSRVWMSDQDRSPQRFATRLKEAVEHANDRIFDYAQSHPEVRGMGTTATAAGVLDRQLFVTQIGDSRAYLIRRGSAMQLTRDQSLMQRLVDAGELTEEEAERSERRNIILQALGPDPHVKVDLSFQPLRRGDTLVLCSDGLTGLVRKDEIAAAANEHPDLGELCTALIDLANERGGPDNITVVAVRFDGEGLEEPNGSDGVGYQNFPLGSAAEDDIVTEAMPARPVPDEVPVSPEPEAGALAPIRVLGAVGVAALLGLLVWWLLRS
ncbi:MAG TPA: Stp1/IreP family PP2C-type Ser/Thr phosphatase [Gemmatimonadales bacterium]|nr:Stp1/IreP family PP2C-type Ser/Thr phosphatase [Gemmatimonadales bacterium]